MKTETKIIIFLLILTPMVAELLTASAPPLKFFNPVIFSILILGYGCPILLIREAKTRWRLQWSVIFLAVAFGILAEGLIAKTFFNPLAPGLNQLSGFGMFLGIQWPHTIRIILSHAAISVLIPLTITALLFPKYKDKPLLKKPGIVLCFIGVSLVTLWGIIFLGPSSGGKTIPYYPHPFLLIGSFLAVIILVFLAYRYRESKIISDNKVFSPFVFGVLGFIFLAGVQLTGMLVPIFHSALTVLVIQSLGIIITLLFVFKQIYNQNTTKRHIVSLIFGALLFYVLLSVAYEFNLSPHRDPTSGMLIVGIVSLMLLLVWRRIVLKN